MSEATEPVDATASLRAACPPLRVHHFILLMTCVAGVAGWRQSLNAKLAEILLEFRSSNTSADILRISLTQSLGYGGLAAVTLASLAWKLRHRTESWQPGQWLALLGAVDFVREVAYTLNRFVPWFGPPENGSAHTLPVWREFAYYLACAAVIGYVALRRHQGWIWRAALSVLALQFLAYSLFHGALITAAKLNWSQAAVDRIFSHSIALADNARLAALCAIAAAAIANLICGPRYSWAHWADVVFWLAFAWSFEIARYLATP